MAFKDYDKCSLLLPMDGANNGTTFTDWSPNPKTVTRNGDAKTVTAQSKYYGSSGYFDGTGDYLTVPNAGDFDVSGDMTISAWVHSTSTDAANIKIILTNRTVASPTKGHSFFIDTGASSHTVRFIAWDAAGNIVINLTTSASISNGLWHHVASIRVGSTWTIYINGVPYATGDESASISAGDTTLSIGRDPSNSARDWIGYMQDILFIKGAALWTSDFTPPDRLIGEISGTVKDSTDTVAERTIIAVPRSYKSKQFTTTSSAIDGTYSLTVPATEMTRTVFAAEGVESSTATGGSTTTITDSTKSWTTNEKIGHEVYCKGEYRTVSANTSTQLTVSTAFTTAPASGDEYDLELVYNDIVDRIIPE